MFCAPFPPPLFRTLRFINWLLLNKETGVHHAGGGASAATGEAFPFAAQPFPPLQGGDALSHATLWIPG